MSHVDDGRLTEYLDRWIDGSSDRQADGWAEREEIEAHLAACAVCRERLEEARALRQRAALLLSAAGPAPVAMPRFEEIQARARAGARKAPRRVFTMSRLTALGWAATIVLAVGVGWLARGSFGFGFRQTEDFYGPAATNAAVPAAAAIQDSLASGRTGERGSQGGVAFSQTAPPAQTEEAVEQDAVARVAARDARNLAAAPPQAPQRTEPQAPAVGALAEREQPAVAKAETAEANRARQAVAGVVTIADEQRAAPGRGEVVVDSAANELAKRVDDAIRAKSWAGTTAQDAERHLGGTLHMVDGLPVESIRIGEVSGLPAATVVQILPGGEQLEIVQWRSGNVESREEQLRMAEEASRAQAPAAPAEGVSRSAVVVAYDDVVLLVRAPVPPDSLQRLARRIP